MNLTKEEYQMVVFLCNCVYKALTCSSGSRKSELLRFKVSFFDDKTNVLMVNYTKHQFQ